MKRLLSLVLALCLVLGAGQSALAAEGESLRLSFWRQTANAPFQVENMFPGDSETRDYLIQVDHRRPITLYHTIEIQPGYEKLAEVLMVRVELPEEGEVLYEGLMREIPGELPRDLAAGETEVLYRITAWLDTSVGNDYQRQALLADFLWWYAEEADSPNTGDNSNAPLYITVAAVSAIAILILLILPRRKKEDADEE